MDKKFTSGDVPLVDLLDQAGNGTLQLPDFQRGWVWDDNHITSLLASVSLSYPIGAVMTLRTGNPDVKFKPRFIEGVTLPLEAEPEFLLLDGQQRITSLYLALRSGGPVHTRDARKNDLSRHYFADIRACIDPYSDREDAIVSVPADGVVRSFRGDVVLDVSTRNTQIDAEMFPLDIVLDHPDTTAWQLDFLGKGRGEQSERLQTWIAFNEAVITPFNRYRVPTIELTRATPKEAVCQVFEKVNTGGVSLTVFELLTATYATDNFNLRDDWHDRRAAFGTYELLNGFAATDFLQILTLLATRERRARHLAENPGDDRAPAVSCKRRDVLRLDIDDYQRWADVVTKAVPQVVRFLPAERVFTARDLPYSSQLVPLTAIMTALGDLADSHGVGRMLRQWYWCGVFGEMYGGSIETRFANDLQDVVAWVNGGDEPRTVRESQFQAERLLTLRTRNSAAYKGLYAQQMKRGGRDFRTGTTIDLHAYVDDAIDVHHIFPKRWFTEHGIPAGIANSVVNKTVIDARTNRRIGGSAPSRYLAPHRVERANRFRRPRHDPAVARHRPACAASRRLRGLLHRTFRAAAQADRGGHRQAGEPICGWLRQPLCERRAGCPARERQRPPRHRRRREQGRGVQVDRSEEPRHVREGPGDRVGRVEVSCWVHEQPRRHAARRRRRRRCDCRHRGGLPLTGRQEEHRRLGVVVDRCTDYDPGQGCCDRCEPQLRRGRRAHGRPDRRRTCGPAGVRYTEG